MSQRNSEPVGARLPHTCPIPVGTESLPSSARTLAAALFIVMLALTWDAGQASAQTKRTNDDIGTGARVSIANASVAEGNQGFTLLRFQVSVTNRNPSVVGAGNPVTISYHLTDGAACCNHGDFQSVAGSLTIPPGTAHTEIPVLVYTDDIEERDESFKLVIDQVNNAVLLDGVATGTILNDDGPTGGGTPRKQPATLENGRLEPGNGPSTGLPPGARLLPSLRILDSHVVEGTSGPSILLFNVELVGESRNPVTLSYRLIDRTARADQSDYQSASATVTIPADRTMGVIAVTVFGDDRNEVDETFSLVVDQATNATMEGGPLTAVGTITNDDNGLGGGSGGPKREDPADATFALKSENPVRGLPSFEFNLPRESRVTLAIYDLAGRRIGTPFEATFAAGNHVQSWTQAPPAPGVYLARLQTEDQTLTRRITWVQ